MATTYPTTIQTFTNPTGTSTLDNPDHATQHANENDTLVAIQNTLGTTAGTALFTAFSASDKPAKKNNETFGTPTITGGTINNAVLGTPSITGGTMSNSVINNATIGTPALTGGTLTLPQIKTHTLGSAVYTGTVSTTQTIDLSAATRHLVNMANSAGSVTLAVSNVTPNQPFVVEILQGTAGNGTINWFSTIRWAGSATPTQTLTASRKDTFGFIPTGASTFDGYIVGQNL